MAKKETHIYNYKGGKIESEKSSWTEAKKEHGLDKNTDLISSTSVYYNDNNDSGGGGGGGGRPPDGPSGHYKDPSEDIADELRRIQRLQEEARQAKINAVINQLDNQAGKMNQSYDDMARQAYINRRQSEENLPQAMKAAGLSGGAAESSILGLMNNYQNNYNENERQRQNSMADIELAKKNAQLTGDSDIADMQAQTSMQGLSLWQQQLAQQMAYDQWAQEMAYQQQRDKVNDDRYNTTWNYQVQQDAQAERRKNDETSYSRELTERNAALDYAKLMAAYGDDSYLNAILSKYQI